MSCMPCRTAKPAHFRGVPARKRQIRTLRKIKIFFRIHVTKLREGQGAKGGRGEHPRILRDEVASRKVDSRQARPADARAEGMSGWGWKADIHRDRRAIDATCSTASITASGLSSCMSCEVPVMNFWMPRRECPAIALCLGITSSRAACR